MRIKPTITKFAAVVAVVASTLAPGMVQATGELSTRSSIVGSSAAGLTGVTYAVKFNAGTAGPVGSIKFEICDSPIETIACAGTGSSSGASLASGTLGGTFAGTNWSTPVWTRGAQTGPGAGGTSVKFAANSATAVGTADQATVTLTNVTNPTAAGEYYLRVTTYSDTGYGTEVDYGAMALDTVHSLTVSGIMPESLVFCVGVTVTSDCSTVTGTSVSLGTFSPTAISSGTSQMAASTNAGSGYVITVNGTVPTSGSNTITAMGTQSANSAACAPSCTSTIGTSQFGTNVRANNSPSITGSADVTPTGAGYNGAGSGGYNVANSYRFFTGDTVASSSNVSNAQTYTNSYLVNVAGSQAAGLYTSTLTYICTATY